MDEGKWRLGHCESFVVKHHFTIFALHHHHDIDNIGCNIQSIQSFGILSRVMTFAMARN